MNADDDHVDRNVVERDVPASKRPALLVWARKAVEASASFFSTVVMGTFHPDASSSSTIQLLRRTLIATGNTPEHADIILEFIVPDEDRQAQLLQKLRPTSALTLLRCQTGALELIADFLGDVLRERELRNVRELADVLVGLPSSAIED